MSQPALMTMPSQLTLSLHLMQPNDTQLLRGQTIKQRGRNQQRPCSWEAEVQGLIKSANERIESTYQAAILEAHNQVKHCKAQAENWCTKMMDLEGRYDGCRKSGKATVYNNLQGFNNYLNKLQLGMRLRWVCHASDIFSMQAW